MNLARSSISSVRRGVTASVVARLDLLVSCNRAHRESPVTLEWHARTLPAAGVRGPLDWSSRRSFCFHRGERPRGERSNGAIATRPLSLHDHSASPRCRPATTPSPGPVAATGPTSSPRFMKGSNRERVAMSIPRSSSRNRDHGASRAASRESRQGLWPGKWHRSCHLSASCPRFARSVGGQATLRCCSRAREHAL